MREEKGDRSGGFHFNNTGRVDIKAGGDIVGHDKVTQTIVAKGFRSQADKDQFSSVIEEMKTLLRELRPAIEKAELPADDKDKLNEAVAAQLNTLNAVKATASAVPLGKAPDQKEATGVTESLEHATSFVDHLKSFAEKTIGFGAVVAPIVAKLGPLIDTARSMFGLG